MTDITYGIVEETYTRSSDRRTVYGIAAYAYALLDRTATVIARINDVTSDCESLNALVEDCNRFELSPLHLNDVVDDFLAAK